MPSVSKAQQRAAGMALAAKRGEIPMSRLKGSAMNMYTNMSRKELEEYASTKRTGLPGKKGG